MKKKKFRIVKDKYVPGYMYCVDIQVLFLFWIRATSRVFLTRQEAIDWIEGQYILVDVVPDKSGDDHYEGY